MNHLPVYKYSIAALVFLFNIGIAIGQDYNYLLMYLNQKDKDQAESALQSISEAGKLILDANEHYASAYALQNNYDMVEEGDQKKKLKNEESKAVSIQIKADKLYASAYDKLYKICLANITPESGAQPEISEYISKAAELKEQAKEKREKAGKNKDPYEKAQLLNEASGAEAAAIENMMDAIALQHGDTNYVTQSGSGAKADEIDVNPQTIIPVDSVAYLEGQISDSRTNIVVNEKQIQQYNAYVSDPTIPEPIMINRSGVSGQEYVGVDDARQYMQQYLYADGTSAANELNTSSSQNNNNVSLNGDSVVDSGSLLAANEATSSTDISQKRGKKEKVVPVSNKTNRQSGTQTQVMDLTGNSSDIRFLIQLAASRVPLTKAQVWAIFPGNQSVEVMKENNWYKYRITGFRSFEEASRIAHETGVKDAWVLASLGGIDVNLVKAKELLGKSSMDQKNYSIDYFVQIAASRVSLTESQVLDILGTTDKYREVIEDGWFKYQIYAGTTFNDAIRLSGRLTSKNFIVVYKRGTKINLNKLNQ